MLVQAQDPALEQTTPQGKALPRRAALGRTHLVLGAINYLALSKPTLEQMYPETRKIREPFRSEIERLSRSLVD